MNKNSKAIADAIDTAYVDACKKLVEQDNPFNLGIVIPTSFKSLWSALAFVFENKIKGWTIVKVDDKYEIR